jgi:hypothetical protein
MARRLCHPESRRPESTRQMGYEKDNYVIDCLGVAGKVEAV